MLEWQNVESCKHLGLNLYCDNTLDRDCDIKRGKFVGKVHSLLQELYFASSDVQLKILNIYCTSFFGSNCWNLFSNNCDRFYKAWNVACRIILKISNLSHRYLIESLTDYVHPKVTMCSRFIKFKQSLLDSNKTLIRLLANVKSLTTGPLPPSRSGLAATESSNVLLPAFVTGLV